MKELLQMDFRVVIISIVAAAVGIKELIQLKNFYKNRAREAFEKEDYCQDLFQEYNESLLKMTETIEELTMNVELLLASDRDTIKSWIVDIYNEAKEDNSKIDSMTMDLLERRYKHYQAENGNSYIHSLMDELREIYKKNNSK